MTLDFSDLVSGSILCGTSCYRQFGDILHTTVPRSGGLDYTVSIHGNAINGAGTVLPDGFLSVPVGASSDARFFINIPDPEGGTFHYTVFFDTTNYPSSDFATVTRTASCSWKIESHGYGELVAGGAGKNRNTREGVYFTPVRIVFEAPVC